MKTMVARSTRNLGLVVIRALASAGHQVVGIDDRAMPFGLHSRHTSIFDHYEAQSEDREFEEVLRLVKLHRPEVLMATSLTRTLLPRADELEAYTNCLLPTPRAYEQITDKLQLHELCAQLDIPAPRILSEQQARTRMVDDTLSSAQRTVVVKPRRDIGGGQGVHMVSDVEQVTPIISDVEEKYGPSFISEFVPGPREDIVAVNLLFDKNSQLIGHFAFKKIRLYPLENGVSALARSIYAPELVEQILPLFAAVGWQGPADAEFKIDAESGEARLLEINGRFSGALAFSIACGVNFPALFCHGATGTARPCGLTPKYSEGVVYWNPRIYLKSLMQDWQTSANRWAAIKDGLGQARGRKVGSPWRLSDPAPILGKQIIQLKEWMRAKRGGSNE